jgi:hypothetical protein
MPQPAEQSEDTHRNANGSVQGCKILIIDD